MSMKKPTGRVLAKKIVVSDGASSGRPSLKATNKTLAVKHGPDELLDMLINTNPREFDAYASDYGSRLMDFIDCEDLTSAEVIRALHDHIVTWGERAQQIPFDDQIYVDSLYAAYASVASTFPRDYDSAVKGSEILLPGGVNLIDDLASRLGF